MLSIEGRSNKSSIVCISHTGRRWFSIEGRYLRWYRQADDVSASGMIDLRHVRSISKLEAAQPYSFCVTTDDRNLIVRSSGYTETNNWIKMLHIHADIARGGSGMNIVSDFNEAPLSSGCRKASRSRSCLTLQQELDLNLRKLQELELSLSAAHPELTLDAGRGIHLEAKSLSDQPDRQSVVETMGTSSTDKRRRGTSRSRCLVDAAQATENLSFDSDDDAMEDRCVVQWSRPKRSLRMSSEDIHTDKQPTPPQEGRAAEAQLHLDDVSEELDSPIPGQGRGSRRTERKPHPDHTFMRGMRHPASSVDAYADSSDDSAYVAEDLSMSVQAVQDRRSQSKVIRTHSAAAGGHARIKAAWGAATH